MAMGLKEAMLQALGDVGQAAGDLAGDEGLAAAGALVVEEDAVAGVEAIGLAVVDGDPVGVELGDGVGAARVEGGGLALGDFLDQAVEFGGGGLVKLGRSRPPPIPDDPSARPTGPGIHAGGLGLAQDAPVPSRLSIPAQISPTRWR